MSPINFDSGPLKHLRMRQLSKRVIHFLLPTILRGSQGEERKNNIAALDGLRGVACLIVFNEHLTYNLTATFLHGLGDGGIYLAYRLPILRLPWAGWSMVDIFFVISGYVLSYKPFKQYDLEQNARGAYGTIATSILKRGPRLYLPTFAALWIIAVCSNIGVFDAGRSVEQLEQNVYWLHEASPMKAASLGQQLADAWARCLTMFNVVNWRMDIHSGDYDMHTWTIPVEFRTSMLLFMALIATLMLSPMKRTIVYGIIMLLASFSELYGVVSFFAGASLAMWDVQRQQQTIALPTEKGATRATPKVSWKVGMFTFWAGLFLISVPVVDAHVDPLFKNLNSMFPVQHRDSGGYVRIVGAAMTTWGVLNWAPAKSLFTNKFSAYLGQISFALYLVHGAVLKAVLHAIIPSIYSWTGDGTRRNQSYQGIMVAWVIGVITCVPLSMWISDIFLRAIDIPTVRFCRWIEAESYRLVPSIRGAAAFVAEKI